MRKRFWNVVSAFSLFCYHLCLVQGVTIHLNKSKSSLPKNDICRVYLKWPSGSGENFQMLSIYFCYFAIISLKKKASLGPLPEQSWIPFTQEWLVTCPAEIDPVVMKKKMKMLKVYIQKDWRSDDRRSAEWLTSQLRWTKNLFKNWFSTVYYQDPFKSCSISSIC